ncbi:MAG: carboxypeptidase regulatory-like domain-containing protein [Kofleriaceae bacterium]
MDKRLLGGIAALLVVLLGVWFFAIRDRGEPAVKKEDKPDPRSAEVVLPKDTKPATQPAAPTGVAPKWSLDADPEGPLVLEGQVQGPDGSGVGGATVWLGSVPPRKTTTESDGTFSFDKLVGRTYALTASAADLVGGPVSYKLTEKSDPVVIRIGAGAAVIVTVTDDEGKPLGGATVKVGEEKSETTDDKGVVTVKPVRPGWIGAVASKDGYADEVGFTTVGAAGATGTIAIKLRKGYYVSGHVVDDRAKPVAKVRVTAHDGMWDFGTDDSREFAVTDDTGAFKVGPLAPGTHTLRATDGEHAPSASSPIAISGSPVTGIRIVMQPGAVIGGTVVDKAKQPVAFATVRVAGKGGNAWEQTARQATTDKAGTFELRGLTRTAVQLRAESDTAASAIADVDLSVKASVTDLVLVLDVTGVIKGRVVDDTGRAVPEVQVNAFPDLLGGGSAGSLALAGLSSATTDGDGAFTVHGLPDGAYRLWAARSSTNLWQDWGQHGTSAKTGDLDVKIVLPAPGGLKGRLAITGAEKSVPTTAFVQIGQKSPTPIADGKFDMQDLSSGTFDITFRGPEFTEHIKRDVKIEPGKTTDLGTIQLVRGRRLSGKVVDKNGPVAGAKVKLGDMLFSAEGNESQMENIESMYGVRSTVTDQTGEFSIIGVPTKATTLVAEHTERGRSSGMTVPDGADDVALGNVTLRGFGSISGVVMQKGKPLGRVTVGQSIKGGGASASFVETAEDGTFSMSKVPEGTIVLQAMQQQMMSMKSASMTVNVVAGRQSKVTIDIPLGDLTLNVTVKALPNNQVDSAQVFLFRGLANFKNGKEITDGFMQGGAQGMKFWLGASSPMPSFDELVAGEYSVCTIPITGSLTDPTFAQRLQENVAALKVYCKSARITPTPTTQTFVHEVPAMTPLPPPTP